MLRERQSVPDGSEVGFWFVYSTGEKSDFKEIIA
jgi:hypothetical protein